jgi:hypothetical protein
VATDHPARITWSAEQVRRGLPRFDETVDPAWLCDAPPNEDGWSLICIFAPPPAEQGNPTLARVHFMREEAPHQLLRSGAALRLFERATGQYAVVEILE